MPSQTTPIHEVWFIVNYNLYESKKYFVQKLSEAFRRKGVGTRIIDLQTMIKEERAHARLKPPSLICSFNTLLPHERTGKYFFEEKRVPYLFFLLDPAYFVTDYLKSKFSIISCVDQLDCDYLLQGKFNNVLFFPHAVERELAAKENAERPYDVVFIGTSYDPLKLKESWSQKYSKKVIELMEEAVEVTLTETAIPFWQAVEDLVKQKGMPITQEGLIQIATDVDLYVRGVDRLELIRSIKDATVHVFGGTSWGKRVKGWPQYFANSSNVVVHPAIPFAESMEVLKKSKICLNSMPFFKKGTHERIFTGLACGSLPITTENLWVQEKFIKDKELLLYRPKRWDQVNEQVNYYLAHDKERVEMVSRGREKVMRDHTWDQRADQILEEVPPLIGGMS